MGLATNSITMMRLPTRRIAAALRPGLCQVGPSRAHSTLLSPLRATSHSTSLAFTPTTATAPGMRSAYPSHPQYSSSSHYSTSASYVPPEKPDYLNDAESKIWKTLIDEFEPTQLLVQDISGGCGSMYAIDITSEKFRSVNMLKQQRMVNQVLGQDLKNWHGLQLRTKIPETKP